MVRLIVNYQKRRYAISVDPATCSVGQFKERVLVACGVPTAQQKLFGLPSNETVLLSRLTLVDGQQFLLYRKKPSSSPPSSTASPRTVDTKGDSDSAWDELPGEVKYLVVGLLDPWTLLACSLVSKDWNELAKDNWVWEEKVRHRWAVIHERPPPASVSWHSLFFEQQRLQSNWTQSRYKVSTFSTVVSCMDYKQHGYQMMCETSAPPTQADTDFERMQAQYNEDRADSMFAAASKFQVFVGNLWKNEAKKTLLGHTAPIHAVAFAGLQHLLSADQSGSMLLWDLHRSPASLPWSVTSSEFVGKRQIHNQPIVALHTLQDRVLAGGGDGTIIFLDLNKAVHPMMTIRRTHRDAVSSFDHLPSSHLFASSGKEGFAKVWDTRTASPIMTFYADAEELRQVKFGWENQLLTAGAGGIRMWDMRTASVLFQPIDELVTAFDYDGTRIVMAGATRGFVSQLGSLGVPPVEPSHDLPTDPIDQGDFFRAYQLPLADTTRVLLQASNLVAHCSGKIVGIDASPQAPKRIARPDTVFEELDEYIVPGEEAMDE